MTDDEGVPLAGARVGLVDLGLVAGSASDGSFAFRQIAAGEYRIAAQMTGYEPKAVRVQVGAGETRRVSIALSASEVLEGFHYTQSKSGFIACGAAWRVSTNEGAAEPCGRFRETGTGLDDLDRFIVNFDPTAGRVGDLFNLVMETQWTASQALSTGLWISWENYKAPAPGGSDYCPCFELGEVRGTSPLRVEIDQDAIRKGIEEDSPYFQSDKPGRYRAAAYPRANALGASSPLDVAVYVNQPFAHFATEFYLVPAPEGFTVIPKSLL